MRSAIDPGEKIHRSYRLYKSVTSRRYKPNGKQECARRVRQIASGQLKPENRCYGTASMFTLPAHTFARSEPVNFTKYRYPSMAREEITASGVDEMFEKLS